MNSEFEYWVPAILDSSKARAFDREFTPISALQHGAPIEFAVPGADLLYLDLAESYLLVTAKIQTAANADPAADAEVGPINLTLHSLFSNVDVDLGGKMISDPNGHYPYRAYLESLLTYDREAQESKLQCAGWYKDTATKMKTFIALGANATNLGLKSRAALFNSGAEVQLSGRIHSDIFHQPLAIPANVPLKIKLTPSKDNFVIVTPAPAGQNVQENYKICITDARLYIHTIEVTHSLALAHEQMLLRKNAHFDIDRVTMKHITIPQGQTSALHDNIFLGQLPKRVVVALVRDAAMAGGYQQNPFAFEHFDVNYLALYVNGEMFPNRPYQPDYTHHKYIREYMSLCQGMGVLNSNRSVSIPRSDFTDGYTIYVFDLTGEASSGPNKIASKSGSIRIELKFSAATPATINILLYAEFDSFIEIDKYRSVIAPF